MKRKDIEWSLGRVRSFDRPKIKLEQYATCPDIAASMAWTMYKEGDVEDRLVGDFGCGCGMLSVAMAACSPSHVIAVDIDEDALAICQDNVETTDNEEVIDMIRGDVLQMPNVMRGEFDTIVMNPPFGTKNNAGLDIQFVQSALKCAPIVYSLHKTSTRNYVTSTAATEMQSTATVIAELRYDLPKTYKFHKKSSVDVQVDFIKFVRNDS